MKPQNCIFALFLAFLPPSIFAAPYHNYVAIDASLVTVENAVGETLEPGNVRFRLGTRLVPFIDLEGHLGLTVNSDEAFQAKWSTDIAAIFLKAHLPVGRYAALYAMGGFSGVSLVETLDRHEFVEERYGFAYGAGVEVVLGESVDLSLDYVNYLRGEGLFSSVSAVSFGLKFYF